MDQPHNCPPASRAPAPQPPSLPGQAQQQQQQQMAGSGLRDTALPYVPQGYMMPQALPPGYMMPQALPYHQPVYPPPLPYCPPRPWAYMQSATMPHQPGGHQMTPRPACRPQPQSGQTSQPPIILQQPPLEPQANLAAPSVSRIEMGKFLQDTNLGKMFKTGKVLKIQDGYGYVEFPSKQEAKDATKPFSAIFEIVDEVDPTSDCPSKPSMSEQLSSTKNVVSSSEAKWCQDKDRPSDHLPMGWSPFVEFLKENKESLVEPQKFCTAAKSGSVSKSVEMAHSTPLGNRFGTGFTHYMAQAHLAGKSWAGELNQSDMVVSTISTSLCMINKFPSALATHRNIKLDLLVLIEHLFRLYEVNGRMPPYLNELIGRLQNPPEDTSSLASNLNALSFYYLKLVNDPAVADEVKLSFLLQEWNVNCKDMTTAEKIDFGKEFPEGKKPTDLAKFVKIDQLLEDVCRIKETQTTTFPDESGYCRHLVNHSDEKFTDFLPVKERFALIGWYLEHVIPRLIDVMFENKANRAWLTELCQFYKKKEFQLGSMPFHEVCSLGKGTISIDTAREDLVENLGIGLRNRPGENNCFLNVTVQMLFHVKPFRKRLLEMENLGGHFIVHELSSLFKALIAAPEGPGGITVSALRTALGTVCPKEHFEEGREHEVTLAMKLIVDSSHLACVSQPGDHSCSCAVRKVFALDGLQWTNCPTCGSQSDRTPYSAFSLSVRASSLLKSMKHLQYVSFGNHLKAALMEDGFPCAENACDGKIHFSRDLLDSPHVSTIEIEWTPGHEDVERIMNCMSSGIDLGTIYENVDENTIHHAVSVACFSGMHYVCFVLQDNVWVMYNDLKVKAVGSWLDLISLCVSGGWKPTLVFFQSAASSSSGEACEASGNTEALVGGN